MAEQAESKLRANGGRAKLTTYEGGHGWRGNPYEMIREGIRWLEQQAQASAPQKAQ